MDELWISTLIWQWQKLQKITEEILSGKKKLGDYEESYKVIDTYLGLFEKGYVNNDYMYIDYNDMIDKLK